MAKKYCGDYDGRNRHDEPCGKPAGWGTDFDDGKCRHHRGTNADGSSHENNTNAVTHGTWTDQSKLYSEEFSERERDLADWIFEDYHGRYVAIHGEEPPAGFTARLSNVAVNVVTEMRVRNWYSDRPEELDTGSETPHIDRETHISESGQRYYRYKKSPAVAAISHLEGYNRKWLREFGLLPDDSADVEVNVRAEMWDNLTGYYSE